MKDSEEQATQIGTIIAALNKVDVLTVPARTGKCQLSLDTGACVNIISEKSFKELKRRYRGNHWKVRSPDLKLSGVTGNNMDLLGVVTIPIRFSRTGESFKAEFYIASVFPLPADGLLGLSTMRHNHIDIKPHLNAITHRDKLYTAMESSSPLLHSGGVVASTVRTEVAAERQSGLITESLIETPPYDSSDIESKKEPNWTSVSAVLSGGQRIRSQECRRLQVRLPHAKEGVDVVCLSETARVKGLSLESTLSTVRGDSLTDVLVLNRTGSDIHLKKGCCLGSFLVYDTRVVPEPAEFPIASVQVATQEGSKRDLIEPHVKVVDYPLHRTQLLRLLNDYKDVIALPGEPLGKTDLAQHYITLQPNANPVYIPAYRLPHSQREIVDNMVDDMLQQGVVQMSASPWNSPLFLVPKKDGGWRPVIDFRRVNQITVPDRYPMPVLNDILQSLGKDNVVFTSLDLFSGYWQVLMDERSREVTAFSTPSGHFEFLRMPFGLRNAPLTSAYD